MQKKNTLKLRKAIANVYEIKVCHSSIGEMHAITSYIGAARKGNAEVIAAEQLNIKDDPHLYVVATPIVNLRTSTPHKVVSRLGELDIVMLTERDNVTQLKDFEYLRRVPVCPQHLKFDGKLLSFPTRK